MPDDTSDYFDATDPMRLRNSLRSLLGLSVAVGTDDGIVDAVRTMKKSLKEARIDVADLAVAERGRILGLVAIGEQREEIEGLRKTLALRTAKRDGTEARADNLSAQLDARDPSDELAALRRQVAELSGKQEAGPRKPWAGTQAGRTVAILLDGLAECATDPAPAAMVRAIRVALGLDAK